MRNSSNHSIYSIIYAVFFVLLGVQTASAQVHDAGADQTPVTLARLMKFELANTTNQTTDGILFEDHMTKMLRKSAFPNLEKSIPLTAQVSTLQVLNRGCKRLNIAVSPQNQPSRPLNIAMNLCPDGSAPIAQMPDVHAARFFNNQPLPNLPKQLPH